MKLIVIVLMLASSFYANSFRGDPALDDSHICIHHTTGGPLEHFGLVFNDQVCPEFTTTKSNGCIESHKPNGSVTFNCPPTQTPTSQHCWVEKRDLSDN